MPNSRFEAVLAIGRDGVIGDQQGLPWRLRSDLIRFRKITTGHALLMGRKTFESIGKPLPGRQTWILSRQSDYQVPGCSVVQDWTEAMAGVPMGKRLFLVGGAEIYRQLLPECAVIHLTRVLADVPGDTRMGDLGLQHYTCVERMFVPADSQNDWPTEYERWVRSA
jgi:dihydrofolate reductase